MRLAFTEEAIDDLDYIRHFLIEAEVENHREIVNDIISCADNLLVFPELGVPATDSQTKVATRDYYHKNFVLRYQITSSGVFILRVWHQKENRHNG